MMEWTPTVTGQNQKHGGTRHGDKVEREQNNKLENLPQRERRIDRASCRGAEAADGVAGFGIDDPRSKDKLLMSLIHKHGVKDIDLGFVDEECLEERRDNRGTFTQDQECTVDPCSNALENREEGNLRQVCEEEEQEVDKARKENDREEAGLEQGPEEAMSCVVVNSLVANSQYK